MKRWLILGLVLILAAGGFYWWKSSASKDIQSGNYRYGKADQGTVQTVVTATGTVEAVTTVLVGSQVSGTIKDILVDFNSPVKKNDIVARLDPTFLQASVTENEAALEKANATLLQAQRDLVRAKDLFEKALIAQADYDNALTAVDIAQAGVQQAKAQLDRAKVNLSYSVIRSPIDGVVISRDVDVGQTVAASLQAPTLFTIAQDLTEMQIETAIDEADIGSLREGMDATFTVDSYPDEEFTATILQIRYAATSDQGVVTYPVILSVANPDLKLRPGMTANVTVITAKRENVLRIPATALRFKPSDMSLVAHPERPKQALADSSGGKRPPMMKEGGERSGTTLYSENDKGLLVPKRVKTGLNDGSYVEIVSGDLAAGDSVIIGSRSTSNNSSRNAMMPGMGPMPGGRR